MIGFEYATTSGVDVRPDGGPETGRVEVEPVATFPVWYAWHPDGRVRPCLVVGADYVTADDWDALFGPEVCYVGVGHAPVPTNPCPTSLDYEAAAWNLYGDADPNGHGRATHVQCVDALATEKAIADVLSCVLLWPEHAPPGCEDCRPTPLLVAGITRRHPADVGEVFERFGLANLSRAQELIRARDVHMGKPR